MKLSEIQRKAFEENYEKFRQAFIEDKHKTASLEEIRENKNRCFTLIEKINEHPKVFNALDELSIELKKIPEFYFQEIPHFTIDCHRYIKREELPEGFDNSSLELQLRRLIKDDELSAYNRILKEEFEKEISYDIALKGLFIGGDCIVVNVWYDHERMIDFTSHLGERVRKEIPSMDFQWGMVKGKVPYRVVNLTRFTGEENKKAVLDFVDANKDKHLGEFVMRSVNLVFSDHYIQEDKTKIIGHYNFAS